jgi:G3E family GTPase
MSCKTTLLNHVLNNRQGLRVAVIVNDMSEVNIDARLVAEGGAELSRAEEKMVEMSNGCICCTLREDLLIEIARLAKEKRFDYLLIESTGISEPLPVAETFTFRDDDGTSLSDISRLDTMVTVVDAFNFLRDYSSQDYIADRGESLGEEDQRTVVNLLVEQVEFCDVIVLNKTDLLPPEDMARLEAILHTLNPRADIVHARFGQVPLDASSTPTASISSRQPKRPAGCRSCAASTSRKPRNTAFHQLRLPRPPALPSGALPCVDQSGMARRYPLQRLFLAGFAPRSGGQLVAGRPGDPARTGRPVVGGRARGGMAAG